MSDQKINTPIRSGTMTLLKLTNYILNLKHLQKEMVKDDHTEAAFYVAKAQYEIERKLEAQFGEDRTQKG